MDHRLELSSSVLDSLFLEDSELKIAPAPSFFPVTSLKGFVDPFAAAQATSDSSLLPGHGSGQEPNLNHGSKGANGPARHTPTGGYVLANGQGDRAQKQSVMWTGTVPLQGDAGLANGMGPMSGSKAIKRPMAATADLSGAPGDATSGIGGELANVKPIAESGPPAKLLLPSRSQTLAMINFEKKPQVVDDETDKKERNCAASARFRKKKREEHQAMEIWVSQLKSRYEDYLARKEKLLAEQAYLEELLALKEKQVSENSLPQGQAANKSETSQ